MKKEGDGGMAACEETILHSFRACPNTDGRGNATFLFARLRI